MRFASLARIDLASLTLGMTEQYPAWSVGRSNLEALTGKSCGLAEDVLVEQDAGAGMLTPVTGPASDALGAGDPMRAGARTALRRQPHALRLRDAHSVVGAERRASGLYSS